MFELRECLRYGTSGSNCFSHSSTSSRCTSCTWCLCDPYNRVACSTNEDFFTSGKWPILSSLTSFCGMTWLMWHLFFGWIKCLLIWRWTTSFRYIVACPDKWLRHRHSEGQESVPFLLWNLLGFKISSVYQPSLIDTHVNHVKDQSVVILLCSYLNPVQW